MNRAIEFSFILSTLAVVNILPGSFCLPASSISKEVDGIRIVGGDYAELGQLPFQLSLQLHGYHFCGAILIKSPFISDLNVALTAAHCTQGIQDLSGLTVMAGSVTLADPSESMQISRIEKIVVHEKYGSQNDIAILFLGESFKKTNYVKAVALPVQDAEHIGDVVVSGWGLTNETSSTISNHLLLTNVSVVPNDKCSELYAAIFGNEEVISDSNICAGSEEGGKDTCQGDSGGPCVSADSDDSVLVGITSWGYGCARPGFPGVYTRAASYVDWIENTVLNNNM